MHPLFPIPRAARPRALAFLAALALALPSTSALTRAEGPAPAMARAEARVAFMPGSFDPPTRAHLAIMRRALSEPGVNKLVVMVNTTNGPKDYLASFGERAEMIRAGLGELAGRVEVIREPAGGPLAAIQDLRTGAGRDAVIAYVGEDAYRAGDRIPRNVFYRVIGRPGQEQVIAANPQVQRISVDATDGISSSRARALIQNGKTEELRAVLDEPVVNFLRRRRLYESPQGEALSRRRADFDRAFATFRARDPRARDLSAPEFNPAQSPEEWPDKFERAARHGPAAGCETRFAQMH